MNKKLCIFDLDGTLLDTIDDIANSMNHILTANGYPADDYNVDWYKRAVGYGARNLLSTALTGQTVDDDKFERMLVQYREHNEANCAVLTRPYEGIPELLSCLADMGMPVAIISNKPERIVCEVVARYFGGYGFAAIYGDVEGKPIKPDPNAERGLLASMGITPAEVIYVGDSEVDMEFAERASLFGIGVTWGFRSREILAKSGAKAIVETPAQILSYTH
jgi:phosphoglycolate phosphatase